MFCLDAENYRSSSRGKVRTVWKRIDNERRIGGNVRNDLVTQMWEAPAPRLAWQGGDEISEGTSDPKNNSKFGKTPKLRKGVLGTSPASCEVGEVVGLKPERS